MPEILLDNKEIILILNFLPKGAVPKGLDPTFYHTLTYDGDLETQKIADELRDKLEEFKEPA